MSPLQSSIPFSIHPSINIYSKQFYVNNSFQGKDAEYQMEFATRSTDNYARLDNPFQKDLTSISSCFWLKVLSIPVTIFAYSTIQSDEEFEAFLTSENILHIVVHDITTSGYVPCILKIIFGIYNRCQHADRLL